MTTDNILPSVVITITSLCWASYLGSQHDAARNWRAGGSYRSISAVRALATAISCVSLLLSIDGTDRQTDRQTDGHRAAAASVNSQCGVHVQYRLRRASWWRSWCREDATTCGPCTTVWWTVFHAELARRPTAACSRANLRPYNIHVHVSHERNRFTTRKVP